MRALFLAVLLCSCLVVSPLFARADDTTIFPPFNGAPPSNPPTECALTYVKDAPTTYCRNASQMLNFTIPGKLEAQTVFRRALPGCKAGQYLSYDGSAYLCRPIPICSENNFLNFDGTNFICAGLTQHPLTGACGPANGVPTTTRPTTGLCSAGKPTAVSGNSPWTWLCLGADGGTDAICSAPRAPNPPPTCGGTVVYGYCFYLGGVHQSCDQVCASHGRCDAAGVAWASSETRPNCQQVVGALTPSYAFAGNNQPGAPNYLGCATYVNLAFNTTPTTCAATASGVGEFYRYCACSH